MSDQAQKTEAIYLWECLHDGTIEGLHSDLMTRTLTLIVNSPYHWEFHKLPSETRFQIVGENVRITETLGFEPWPGATEPSREVGWHEAQEQRRQEGEKGRLISTDWKTFVAGFQTDEDHEILEAALKNDQPLSVLELGIYSYPNCNWYTVKIHAERFRFYVANRELSLDSFREFGGGYWKAFAERSEIRSSKNRSSRRV